MSRKPDQPTTNHTRTWWIAQTGPRFLEVVPAYTTIDVMNRQVEVTLHFDDAPDGPLAQPKKLISRDPAVVAFHRRIHGAITSRMDAIERAAGADDQESVA